MIYLASPYSHSDPWVRQERYEQNLRAYVKLLRKDLIVFAPIVMTHRAGEILAGVKDHAFWMMQDRPFLERADKLLVLALDGWNLSRGVAEEIELAGRLGIPIQIAKPEEL